MCNNCRFAFHVCYLLDTTYHSEELVINSLDAPSTGGLAVIETMNILETMNISDRYDKNIDTLYQVSATTLSVSYVLLL